MNNINGVLEEKANCVGCRACANICPVSAITMKEDEEGFFYPVIDDNKCTNCGLCKKACPSLNKSETYLNNGKNPDCYAVMADDDIRLVSSSGGAFSLIANRILEQGGYVCGVAFVGQKVKHIIIDNKEDLYKLRGSKYVQSDTNTVYSQIKELLKSGKTVLFTGTPCQVAGLNTFLAKKYENLFTVDLICHGVPPQKIFDMYLEETLSEDDVFEHTTFRDKKQGWGVYTTTTTTTGKHYYGGSVSQDTYLQAFIRNMCLRPSCGTCPYTSTQRESDITIGDFWAIERFDEKLNDNKGTSVILVNSAQGKKIFKLIKTKTVVCKKVPLEYASYYNITLKTPLKQHTNRRAFFRMMNAGKNLKEITDYCNKNRYDIGIFNYWFANNYGGLLTSYSLQKIIENLGYNSLIIKNNNPHNSYITDFALKNLKVTEKFFNKENANKLNQYFNTFIVGSDCVFAPEYCVKFFELFMFTFAHADKKKISYAASFGQKFFNGDFNLKPRFEYYLKQFDNISTRELSGVDIVKNEFNINATQVSDPVFLHNREFFENLIDKKDKNILCDISYYIFHPNTDTAGILEELSNVIGKKLNNINMKQAELSPSQWLANIKNSKFVLTQSYHGACFAIIFNVPFVFIENPFWDNARIESLLKILDLKNRILKHNESIKSRPDLFEPIDWDKVNSILAKEKERSLKWLKDAIEAPKDLSKINPADAIIQNLNNKILDLQDKTAGCITLEGLNNVLEYNKNYRKYVKYKILKNFVFGTTRDRYKRKQKIYHEKIRSARRVKRGIAGV